MVGANAGLIGMSKEHLAIALALNVPVAVCITKVSFHSLLSALDSTSVDRHDASEYPSGDCEAFSDVEYSRFHDLLYRRNHAFVSKHDQILQEHFSGLGR